MENMTKKKIKRKIKWQSENVSNYMSYYRSVMLLNVVHNAPHPQNTLITYRGVKSELAMPHIRYIIGENIVFTRFTSVTTDVVIAKRFALDKRLIMKIIIPPPRFVCI